MTEKSERVYSVYKHTLPMEISGKVNDMVYIGITRQNPPEKRWQNGTGYRNRNGYFWNAIQKYGFDSFCHEILFRGLTKKEAEQKEIELIEQYKSNTREFGYNISNGGNCIGTMAQETKDKISKANMGNKYGLGHKHTEETKRKISEANKGNQYGKGRKMPDHVKQILADSHKTEEFRKKLSEANKGKKHSEETKKKLSEAHKGKSPFAKKVVCIETGIVYDSIKDATNQMGLKGHGGIHDCCEGIRQTAGGYHWCYENDYCEEKVKELLAPRINKHCIPILCIDTNKVYNSILEASLDTGISETKIGECCSGKYLHAGWLRWIYLKDATEENINRLLSIDIFKTKPKQVYCIELNMVFDNANKAGKYIGVDGNAIRDVCKGKNMSSGKLPDGTKLHWMYYEDYLKQQEKQDQQAS